MAGGPATEQPPGTNRCRTITPFTGRPTGKCTLARRFLLQDPGLPGADQRGRTVAGFAPAPASTVSVSEPDLPASPRRRQPCRCRHGAIPHPGEAVGTTTGTRYTRNRLTVKSETGLLSWPVVVADERETGRAVSVTGHPRRDSARCVRRICRQSAGENNEGIWSAQDE